MSRASFFYCVGTGYFFNFMQPLVGSIISFDLGGKLRVFNQIVGGDASVQTGTVAGLNGKTYTWNLTPEGDPFPSMLDPELWDERVTVAYPASFVPMGAGIDYGRDRMIEKIVAMPAGKKFAIGGYSQGAAVASSVYLSGLKPGTTGPLVSRRDDFLGAVCYGNPRRAVNHRGAGGQFGTWSGSWWDDTVDTNCGGAFPTIGAHARLTDCEDKWVEFTAPGDIFSSHGASLTENRWTTAISAAIGALNPQAFLNTILTGDLDDIIGVAMEMLFDDGFGAAGLNRFVDAVGMAFTIGGGGHTTYPMLGPPNSSGVIPTTTETINGVVHVKPVGDTCYQLALKYLNGLAAQFQTAPIIVPPTTTAGWSTTLIPPAA